MNKLKQERYNRNKLIGKLVVCQNYYLTHSNSKYESSVNKKWNLFFFLKKLDYAII